jgi:hypothetical protein
MEPHQVNGPFNSASQAQAHLERITVPAIERAQSGALKELADALAKAQAEIKHVNRENTAAKGTARSYKYADLASVLDVCREVLPKNGLSIVQQPVGDGQRIGVVTMLLHTSGQHLSSTVYAKPIDPGPQAIGSVITYLRRYSIMAVVGIAPDDDDGAAASPPLREAAKAEAPKVSPATGSPVPPATGPTAGATPPAASAGPTLVSQKKYRRLAEKLGVTSEVARVRISALVGREVKGLNDLSQAEMDNVIDVMEKVPRAAT